MRWLVDHLRRCRATQNGNGERGAVAVITAFSLVVLLGFAALAIDVGMLYQERTELQSGADAAAVAIAQDCAVGRIACDTPKDTAQGLANANAKDGAAAVVETSVSMAKQTVGVRLATGDKSGVGSLSLAFARVLGMNSAKVGAVSGARWSGIKAGPVALPVAFAQCEVTAKFTNGDVVIDMQDNKNSTACPSGATGSAGGFGWYKATEGDKDPACQKTVTTPGTVYADTGANFPKGCQDVLDQIEDEIESGASGKIILFPVYGTATGTGAGGQYPLTGWVAFEVKGWKLTGNREYNFPDCGKGKDQCNKGIYGRFVKYVELDDVYEPSNGKPTNGLAVVELTD
jgi:hypothetical protein